MKHFLKAAMLAATLAAGTTLATPAAAQESVYTPGPYWTVTGIHIEDGQFENYMDYLADAYRRSQDFARQQGWITNYRIFANANPREDEPELYLIVESPRLATPQEETERERLLNAHMRQTTRAATEGSGRRVTMRRLGSNILLQEVVLRPAR